MLVIENVRLLVLKAFSMHRHGYLGEGRGLTDTSRMSTEDLHLLATHRRFQRLEHLELLSNY